MTDVVTVAVASSQEQSEVICDWEIEYPTYQTVVDSVSSIVIETAPHFHDNKVALDKIGEDLSGSLTYNGSPVVSNSGGYAGYTHTQSTALAIWTVPHNLNRKPTVTVVDNLDRRVEPDVSYIDFNIVRITHASPQIGKVYVN